MHTFPFDSHSQLHMQCSDYISDKLFWLFSFISGTHSIHLQHTKLFPSTPSTPLLFYEYSFMPEQIREQIQSWSFISQSWKNFLHKDKKIFSCQLKFARIINRLEEVRRTNRTQDNKELLKLMPQEPQSRAFQPSPEYTILFLVKTRNWAAVPK